MRFKIFAMAVIVLGLVAATALAADVTGTWVAEREGRDGQTMKTTFELKADGTDLTGTMDFGMGMGEPNPISEGKIDGDNISFVVKMDMMGNEMKISYKGTVTGDEMKLTMSFEGGMGGPGGGGPGGGAPKTMEMIAKRQK
jgi:opacity protein-like surface antigen